MKIHKPIIISSMVLLAAPLFAQTESISSQRLSAELCPKPFTLTISDASGKTLLKSAGPIRFTRVQGQKSPSDKAPEQPWTELLEVRALTSSPGRIKAELAPGPGQPANATIQIFFLNDNALKVEIEAADPAVNRVSLNFHSGPDDRYFGMGERFNSADQTGNLVYNWSEEGCLIGCKNTVVTYFPVPFYLDPRGCGFLLDDTHYSSFDFGKTRPGVFELVNWNSSLKFVIFSGPKPLDIIENMTAYTGRVTVPPAWAFAPWVAATASKLQGAANGQEHARKVVADCRKNHIPCSALWSEDWAWNDYLMFLGGKKGQWDLNRKRYPDYEKLAAELEANGMKFLAYFHPYIGYKSEAFKEAGELGYLMKTSAGQPCVFSWLLQSVGQPDLTSPEASRWWQDRFFARAESYGVDGWMHDFSEYTPAWAQFSDGRDGWAVHNDYPVLWAKAGREFWERTRPNGDWAFFMRAGYTGSWKYSPVTWTGDQNMNWEKYDGIPSVIPAVNSVGISGSAITATDIAGYHCVASQATDKELFFRWTQLGALLPVMRTHEASGCNRNWLFNSDQETLAHFKKYAALHVSLFPYIYTLAHEAAKRGWPVVRHLMLQYPDDPGSRDEQYQFMLGDRILVAPVLVDHAREREVYFPPGEWVDWWEGKHYQGPARIKVAAPLDRIPLFVKAGTLVPLFDSEVDTLVKINKPGIRGWDEADQSIKVMFFGKGEDEFTLWDGTSFSCDGVSQKCGVSKGAGRRYGFEFRK